MSVIAIVNRKGGSGKSTLATSIAVAWAASGKSVMLGDVDRQQSVRSWLRRRGPGDIPINTWVVDQRKVLRPPAGTSHVVLDTPGAMYGLDLAKVVMRVDALVVPVGPSVFDRDASLDFIEELKRLPRVASGQCKVAVVGMRWSGERTKRWFENRQWDIPLVTVFPDSAEYRNFLDQGRTLFDQAPLTRHPDMQYWQPLLDWLEAMSTARVRPASPTLPQSPEVPAYLRMASGNEVPAVPYLEPRQSLSRLEIDGAPKTREIQALERSPVPEPVQEEGSSAATETANPVEQKPSSGLRPSRWWRIFG
jgi:cellulose biosynthesis protein BcsQ